MLRCTLFFLHDLAYLGVGVCFCQDHFATESVVNASHDSHHALVVAIVRYIVERTQVELVVHSMPEMIRRFVRVPSHHVQFDMLNQWICGVLDILLHRVEDELG